NPLRCILCFSEIHLTTITVEAAYLPTYRLSLRSYYRDRADPTTYLPLSTQRRSV
ncbi:unnamed protein product, partial [Amoebophrya sp. A120]